ncbi:MAG: glycosyltransferase family protein [Ilumatobacteraceae bacterium]
MARRIVMYSHDSYGLGHLSRTMAIAKAVVDRSPSTNVLLVTGTPRPQAFSVPNGVDLLKLPAISKSDDGAYVSRTLRLPVADVIAFRSRLIRESVVAFEPDVVLVDHVPTGVGGELMAALATLGGLPSKPRLVLGLRDIIDDSERVRRAWDADGSWAAIDDHYDQVLVYGDEMLRTTAVELELASAVRCPVEHTGYVTRGVPPRSSTRTSLPTVLVTVGGGGDGHFLLRAYASMLAEVGSSAEFRSVVVTGPLLSPARRAEVEESLAASGAPVEILTFSSDHTRLVAEADAIVAMAGYNTTCEILASSTPALLVPRDAPRVEQLLRAQRLAALGFVDMATRSEVDSTRIRRFVDENLRHRSSPVDRRLRLDGADRVAELIGSPLMSNRGVPVCR